MRNEKDLICPNCKGDLTSTGQKYVCSCCGEFSCEQGIARFLGGHPFDAHWRNNLSKELPRPKLALGRDFLEPLMGNPPSDRARLLDAGCGDGVHAYILDDLIKAKSYGAFGVDASIEALKAAQSRVGANWTFAEADLENLPFRKGYFDVVYAFGSVEYTSSPRKTFNELCRVLRPGGRIGVWILPPPEGMTGFLLTVLRRLSAAGGKWMARILADLIVPMLLIVPNQSGLSLRNATWRQCREAVLVNIASPELTTFTEDEVRSWFRDEGLVLSDHQSRIRGSLWGTKPNDAG